MQKIILLSFFVAGILITSCKKNYTCTCYSTETDTDSSGVRVYTYKNSSNPYAQKMTESQAKSACDHEQASIQSDFYGLITYNGKYPVPSGISFVTTCSIN